MDGRTLEVMKAASENPRRIRKDTQMWVYDGDEWINESANVPEVKSENENVQRDEFYPEMQVVEVEIVPPTRVEYLPMLPLH